MFSSRNIRERVKEFPEHTAFDDSEPPGWRFGTTIERVNNGEILFYCETAIPHFEILQNRIGLYEDARFFLFFFTSVIENSTRTIRSFSGCK